MAVTDSTAPISAGPRLPANDRRYCGLRGNLVRRPSSEDLGDGDDSAQLRLGRYFSAAARGGAGSDRLTVAQGYAGLLGGPGDDVLSADGGAGAGSPVAQETISSAEAGAATRCWVAEAGTSSTAGAAETTSATATAWAQSMLMCLTVAGKAASTTARAQGRCASTWATPDLTASAASVIESAGSRKSRRGVVTMC